MKSTAATTMDRDHERDVLMDRGMALYDDRLRTILEREHLGEMVAIEPDSGEYAVAVDSSAATRALRARNVVGLLFFRRIGPPTDADRRFAASVAASEASTQ